MIIRLHACSRVHSDTNAHAYTQTDIARFSLKAIEVIVKRNPLSEEEAQNLIRREQNGRARKYVLKFLGVQVRRASKKKTTIAFDASRKPHKRGRPEQSHSAEPSSKKSKGSAVYDGKQVNSDALIGARIKKYFENFGFYEGEVISHDVDVSGETIYRIKYSDGDEEDLFFSELQPLLCETGDPNKTFTVSL